MEDAVPFFRQRALACFCRRRKHQVLSAEWWHDMKEARWFIRNI